MEINLAKKNDIPIKIIEKTFDIVTYALYHNFNNLNLNFQSILNEADITPDYTHVKAIKWSDNSLPVKIRRYYVQ